VCGLVCGLFYALMRVLYHSMPKIFRAVLIPADAVSRDDAETMMIPGSDKLVSVMKDKIFKTDRVVEHYVFPMHLEGSLTHVCFCYQLPLTGAEDSVPNMVANAVFQEIYGDTFAGTAICGPLLVYVMHPTKGVPRKDMYTGEMFDNFVKQIHHTIQTELAPVHGVWGRDMRPLA